MTLEETERKYLNEIYDMKRSDRDSPAELNAIERMLLLGISAWFKHSLGETTEIFAQSHIGTYRVDFLIETTIPNTKKVIIECDGHDFHEKTKEQAKRDKQRDRFFQSKGYQVLRFTGSEVYKDPFKCGEEIFYFVYG